MSGLIDKIALKIITDEFDKFISECIDETGKPKIPSHKAISQARACMPKDRKTSFVKDKK